MMMISLHALSLFAPFVADVQQACGGIFGQRISSHHAVPVLLIIPPKQLKQIIRIDAAADLSGRVPSRDDVCR